MIKFKRVLISSLLGLGFGLVSILIGYGYGGFKSPGGIWATVLNRAVIGFVIGISGLKIFYPLHGLLIGLLVGLPYACWWLDKGGGPFLVLFLLGGLWGLLIEILTTRVFRSPARK
jgi:hypothetical protein